MRQTSDHETNLDPTRDRARAPRPNGRRGWRSLPSRRVAPDPHLVRSGSARIAWPDAAAISDEKRERIRLIQRIDSEYETDGCARV